MSRLQIVKKQTNKIYNNKVITFYLYRFNRFIIIYERSNAQWRRHT